MSYRCDACGNKTRFDIFETKRVRAFYHYSLGGQLEVEEEEVIDSNIEKVVCRWCGSSDSISRGAGSAGPQNGEAGSAGSQTGEGGSAGSQTGEGGSAGSQTGGEPQEQQDGAPEPAG